MTNYRQQYRDGYLEDEPLTRYEKLKTNRHKTNPEKNRTVARHKARLERLKVVGGLEYRNRYNPVT